MKQMQKNNFYILILLQIISFICLSLPSFATVNVCPSCFNAICNSDTDCGPDNCQNNPSATNCNQCFYPGTKNAFCLCAGNSDEGNYSAYGGTYCEVVCNPACPVNLPNPLACDASSPGQKNSTSPVTGECSPIIGLSFRLSPILSSKVKENNGVNKNFVGIWYGKHIINSEFGVEENVILKIDELTKSSAVVFSKGDFSILENASVNGVPNIIDMNSVILKMKNVAGQVFAISLQLTDKDTLSGIVYGINVPFTLKRIDAGKARGKSSTENPLTN